MRHFHYAVVLFAACAAQKPEEPQDSGGDAPSDSAIELPPCAPEGFPSGEAVGEANCSEGVCTIPSGVFWRGQTNGDADACPLHQVELREFRIDQSEVSQSEYRQCVDAGVCKRSDPECDYIAKNWD